MPTEPLAPDPSVEIPATYASLRHPRWNGRRVATATELLRQIVERLHRDSGMDYFALGLAVLKLLDDCVYAAAVAGEHMLPEDEAKAAAEALCPGVGELAARCEDVRLHLEIVRRIRARCGEAA